MRDPAEVARGFAARRPEYSFLADVGRDRALLLGGYEDEDGPAGSPPLRFNAAMLREKGGTSWDLYRKVRLIPFGETMPLSGVFPALANLLPQGFRMTAGASDQPMLRWKERSLRLLPFVCYEALDPRLLTRIAGDGRPDLLVNLTNDSWFGDTWEPWQHLAFSRLRAIEHRAPMVRSTNTGVSAFVDATGAVVSTLGFRREGVLVADLPLVRRGRTPYEATAALQTWLWVGLGAAAFGVTIARRRPKSARAGGG
jgi:apolipoprotein N-acyltransferase